MDIVWETLGFAAKGLIVFAVIAASAIAVFSQARSRRPSRRRGHLRIDRLDDRIRELHDSLRVEVLPPKDYKRRLAARAKLPRPPKNLFVLDFKGDVLASAVESLREEVSAVLAVAGEGDEVLLRLESPGGAAHGYGLAAAQLARLRGAGVRLTVSVDRMAASGGYMMACVADEIIAAPFAIVGSIGVVAPLPNLHRLLDRHGIDYENATAGKYKRTVSYLAAVTDEGRQKLQEQLDETHALFKDLVQSNRPSLDVDAVATGEYWHGTRALELGLVNRLVTSDDYLLAKLDQASMFELEYKRPSKLRDRFAATAGAVVERSALALWSRATETPYGRA